MNLRIENKNKIPNNLKAGLSNIDLLADLGGPFVFLTYNVKR